MSKANEILIDVIRKCGRLGVSVLVSDDKQVDCDGVWTSGWFDAEGQPKLAIAVGVDEYHWLGVLLHEYGHVQQWVEQSDLWRAVDAHTTTMHDWLDGKSCKNIAKVMAETQALEADAERRAVRLIKEYGADIDLDKYCRQANAYLHFHNVLLETRKWFAKGKGPYQSPEVWPLFNPTIDNVFKTNAAQRKALIACTKS